MIKRNNFFKASIVISVMLLTISTNATHANEFKSSVSLYLWIPSIDGKMTIPPPPEAPEEEPLPIDPGEVLDAIDMIFMGSYEVEYNKILFLVDIVYLDLSNTKNVDILDSSRDVALGLEGWQSTYYGGYSLLDNSDINLDIIAGVRYFSLEIEAEVERINTEKQRKRSYYEGLLDGVIGVKGRYNITKNWFIPFHADAGSGQSDLTYQLASGVAFGGSWGDVTLLYRHLAWDISNTGLLEKFSLSGASLGYRYHF